MDKRPVIGVMPGYDREKDRLYTAAGYMEGVAGAGGLPFLLPLDLPEGMAPQIMDKCDGFLFTGGPDIDARVFGEENLKCQGGISPQRDKMELELAKLAVSKGKAILGICRGIQLINAAMGGTLHQDIYLGRNQGTMLKHWQEAPDWYPVHDVRIEPASKLNQIFGTDRLAVNSYHHQAVKETGAGLVPAARTSDGIIEAVESSDSRFILGVQWHPEMMWKYDIQHLKLFSAFVEAAALS